MLSTKNAFNETDATLWTHSWLSCTKEQPEEYGDSQVGGRSNGVLEALKTNNSSMDLVPLVMENAATA